MSTETPRDNPKPATILYIFSYGEGLQGYPHLPCGPRPPALRTTRGLPMIVPGANILGKTCSLSTAQWKITIGASLIGKARAKIIV